MAVHVHGIMISNPVTAHMLTIYMYCGPCVMETVMPKYKAVLLTNSDGKTMAFGRSGLVIKQLECGLIMHIDWIDVNLQYT